ncbi:PhnD/SsuA/transferrin family substrate-binding protein [Verticiella sediminum]|uniref:PhnD/SsuA/transferrin family substrate-binding protein n=1 Tax=Verticiella sediminum TaxID=1247510 RepID=A0A556A5U0_9BURK|nr:ABC transporter substrate-binding protein [Verticiella sediminum]TSH88252.1 PhnD/SsuA/transferrin family substrate-binding protein [Verticiella sediminum]
MSNPHNPVRRRVLGSLAAGIAVAAFSRRATADTPPAVRIGVATAGGGNPITWGGSPGSVARLNRWLEEALEPTGTKVQWLFFKGAGPAVNEALSNRQIDLAYQGDLPAVVGRANGLKTRILLASGTRNNLYLVTPPDSDIRSVADLKGRTVSIFRGTNGHLVAINVLAAHGLTERDIKGVNLDTGSAQAAIASKGVEAAFGGQEWFKLRDQGLAKIVYSTQGQDPRFTRQAHVLARQDFIDEHPDTVQRAVDVFVRAADWASDEANREALFELWARSGVPHASYVAEFENQQLDVRNSPLIDEFVRARYHGVVQDALALKLIRREVSVDDWFEPRFLQQSLAANGLAQRWSAYAADGSASAASVARS